MQEEIRKRHYTRATHQSTNNPWVNSRNKMVLQTLDQDKSFRKLLKFQTWFCFPCTMHLTMVCFTSDICFGYFKQPVKN